MIRAEELQALRAALEQTLNQTAALRKAVVSVDAMGAVRSTWTPAGNVPVRLMPARPGASIAGPRAEGGEHAREALFPAWADIDPGDRVEIGGMLYEVADVVGHPFGLFLLAQLRRL